MIIEDIKKYFETKCTVLGGKHININCLGKKIGSVSLKTVPCYETVKEYADGGSLKQYVFDISVRTAFDGDSAENTDTAVFMEKLKNWVSFDADAQAMEFSQEKAAPLEFEVLKTHGVSYSDRSGAEHSMRLRLIYEQK